MPSIGWPSGSEAVAVNVISAFSAPWIVAGTDTTGGWSAAVAAEAAAATARATSPGKARRHALFSSDRKGTTSSRWAGRPWRVKRRDGLERAGDPYYL